MQRENKYRRQRSAETLLKWQQTVQGTASDISMMANAVEWLLSETQHVVKTAHFLVESII